MLSLILGVCLLFVLTDILSLKKKKSLRKSTVKYKMQAKQASGVTGCVHTGSSAAVVQRKLLVPECKATECLAEIGQCGFKYRGGGGCAITSVQRLLLKSDDNSWCDS